MSLTYYDILQLNKNASATEIKKSFRYLALKYHPDKNRNSESNQMFLKIVEAYEVLSDTNLRRKYDLTLRNEISQNSFHVNGKWIPSADLSSYYSYEVIKNWKVPRSTGGIWDIGEKENRGMWKTTLALFGCLATLAVFIIVVSS
ncbi:J domain-containing protein [Candidatus Nitrosocosmicus franklandus]|uniref:J domain-containing protein n=1 Tax=Candidatus Nitrosocosmicus franklandianus TaxID=1798806 RepID=UPI0018D4EEFD|nr:J domain-containing protein [Candidatus Nitrosocosmicus franklandus]